MTDPHLGDAVGGKAWADFCDSLKSAGQLILDHSTDDLDRIEGFRYLSRLARGGLLAFIENGDPVFAQILPIPHNLKIGCDNPDALYQNVAIDPAYRYRIHGPRGTVNYLSVGAYSGGYGAGAARPGRQGVIEDNDPDAGGYVDLIASVDEPEGLAPGQRWLRMAPETTTLIIRNFYLDRTAETPSDLRIDCLNPPTPVPGPFSAAELVEGLAMAGLFVHGVVRRFVGWVDDYLGERPNTLDFIPGTDSTSGWGDPNQLIRMGYWTLAPGQALVVDVPPLEAHYWNFQLNNIWEESLDYHHLQVTVNKHTARYRADGTARIVVAAEDPGCDNWIDTAGHRHGTMGLRYNQAAVDLPPTCRVADLAEVGGLD